MTKAQELNILFIVNAVTKQINDKCLFSIWQLVRCAEYQRPSKNTSPSVVLKVFGSRLKFQLLILCCKCPFETYLPSCKKATLSTTKKSSSLRSEIELFLKWRGIDKFEWISASLISILMCWDDNGVYVGVCGVCGWVGQGYCLFSLWCLLKLWL